MGMGRVVEVDVKRQHGTLVGLAVKLRPRGKTDCVIAGVFDDFIAVRGRCRRHGKLRQRACAWCTAGQGK